MRFEKYQSLGNDFILVEGKAPDSRAIQSMCDRKFGIGADGVLVVGAGRSEIFNADGSPGGFSGNGARIIAKYLAAKENSKKVSFVMGRNAVTATIMDPFGVDSSVETLMEVPCNKITTCSTDGLDGFEVDVGNPHRIFFVNELKSPTQSFSAVTNRFPAANAHFVKFTDGFYEMRSFERGVGATMACSSGVCALMQLLVGIKKINFDEPVRVSMPGGEVDAMIKGGVCIRLVAEATRVFSGECDLF